MKQTKWQSFLEVNTSTFIGFIVSYILSYTVLPLYGVEQSHSVSFQITMIYTVASIFRGYFVRRYFNRRIYRPNEISLLGISSIPLSSFALLTKRWAFELGYSVTTKMTCSKLRTREHGSQILDECHISFKSLNEKYDIPFLSEWKHKDGGIYTALKVEHCFKGICGVPIVAYTKILSKDELKEWQEKGILNFFVRTVFHFKDSFTKLEENAKDGF